MSTKTTTTEPETLAERFAREAAHHKLTVLHDDGLYRHLRCMSQPPGKPPESAYWFELITVPGSLIFRGDGESFVFARIRDMFEFFRSNPDRNVMRISPDYWAEKLTSSRDAAKVYSRKLLDQNVAEVLAEAEDRSPGVTQAWKFETAEGGDYDLDYEDSAREALRDFEHRHEDETFQFTDTWEWDLKDFDWWYLWACHAIVWGIARYDEARKAAAPAAAPAVAAYDWRALTIRQPWCAAIVHGTKNIENRTQQTHRRGPVLIHAGQSTDRDAPGRNPALARWLRPMADASLLVFGAIVGVAQIVDCHPAQAWWRGGCCAPWGESGPASESAWHWVLTGRRALREPVPARGALGFWRPPGDVLAAVLDQLGGTS